MFYTTNTEVVSLTLRKKGKGTLSMFEGRDCTMSLADSGYVPRLQGLSNYRLYAQLAGRKTEVPAHARFTPRGAFQILVNTGSPEIVFEDVLEYQPTTFIKENTMTHLKFQTITQEDLAEKANEQRELQRPVDRAFRLASDAVHNWMVYKGAKGTLATWTYPELVFWAIWSRPLSWYDKPSRLGGIGPIKKVFGIANTWKAGVHALRGNVKKGKRVELPGITAENVSAIDPNTLKGDQRAELVFQLWGSCPCGCVINTDLAQRTLGVLILDTKGAIAHSEGLCAPAYRQSKRTAGVAEALAKGVEGWDTKVLAITEVVDLLPVLKTVAEALRFC